MSTVYGLWIFYKKLIIPSLIISVALTLLVMTRMHYVSGIGISFIFLTPAIHYLIYDVRSPHEYYFYYNLGFSKLTLWINTILISLATGLILMAF